MSRRKKPADTEAVSDAAIPEPGVAAETAIPPAADAPQDNPVTGLDPAGINTRSAEDSLKGDAPEQAEADHGGGAAEQAEAAASGAASATDTPAPTNDPGESDEGAADSAAAPEVLPKPEQRRFMLAGHVLHDGTSYGPGDDLDLTFDEHAPLFAARVVRPWADGKPVEVRSPV